MLILSEELDGLSVNFWSKQRIQTGYKSLLIIERNQIWRTRQIKEIVIVGAIPYPLCFHISIKMIILMLRHLIIAWTVCVLSQAPVFVPEQPSISGWKNFTRMALAPAAVRDYTLQYLQRLSGAKKYSIEAHPLIILVSNIMGRFISWRASDQEWI